MTGAEPPRALVSAEQPSQQATWLVLAVTLLGVVLFESRGMLSQVGIAGLTLVIAAAWFAPWASITPGPPLQWVVVAPSVLVSASCLAAHPLLGMLPPARRTPFIVASGVASLLALSVCVVELPLQRRLLPLLALLTAFMGWWLFHVLPFPRMDVTEFQRESLTALLAGRNPYAMTFPDIYPPRLSRLFYAPGLSVNGTLQFGFPYMPITLVMALPSYLLGDLRYTSLACVVVAALLIAAAKPSRTSHIAAALLLMSPALPLMLVMGWNDSYVVLFVAAAWFCQCRAPRLLPWVVGLLFVTKQYSVIFAPIVLLLLPRPWHWRAVLAFGWRAAVAGAVVTLPLMLPDVHGFINSVVLLQIRQPFRHDALSYLAWANPAAPERWMALPFALAALAWVVLLRRDRTHRVSAPAAIALTMLPFIAFNKQAFLNYYFLVLGALCCAIAASGHPAPDTSRRSGISAPPQ